MEDSWRKWKQHVPVFVHAIFLLKRGSIGHHVVVFRLSSPFQVQILWFGGLELLHADSTGSQPNGFHLPKVDILYLQRLWKIWNKGKLQRTMLDKSQHFERKNLPIPLDVLRIPDYCPNRQIVPFHALPCPITKI